MLVIPFCSSNKESWLFLAFASWNFLAMSVVESGIAESYRGISDTSDSLPRWERLSTSFQFFFLDLFSVFPWSHKWTVSIHSNLVKKFSKDVISALSAFENLLHSFPEIKWAICMNKPYIASRLPVREMVLLKVLLLSGGFNASIFTLK